MKIIGGGVGGQILTLYTRINDTLLKQYLVIGTTE